MQNRAVQRAVARERTPGGKRTCPGHQHSEGWAATGGRESDRGDPGFD